MGIERGALGSLLGHSGPIGESERYAAHVFGAHRSYSVLNGTSGSNRAIMSACVGDDEIALCDRNCHKSIEQGLVAHRRHPGLPAVPTRNRYGIIGPISPRSGSSPKAIAKAIAANPLAKAGADQRPVYAVLTNCTYDGMCYDAARRRGAAREERRPHPLRRGVVRLRALQPDVPRSLRDARRSRRTHADGPTVFATHSTHKLLAALSQTSYHPHPRRPRRHRSRPLQRGVLLRRRAPRRSTR